MTSQVLIIFIIVASLLLSSCARYIKQDIPKSIIHDVVKTELTNSDNIIEVKINDFTAPIRIKGIENDDILLGVDSKGDEVKIAVKDIEEAWVRYLVVSNPQKSTQSSDDSYSCHGGPPPLVGTGIVYIDMLTTTTSYTSSTTSCITSEAEGKAATDEKQLEYYIQVNYYNIAKEAASICDEYIDALYDQYIKSLYVEGSQPISLTSDFFCQTLNNNYTVLFEDNEYNEFFLPALNNMVNHQLTDDI